MKDQIPFGPYCYSWIEPPSSNNGFKGKSKKCPFYSYKTINNVKVAWCDYLQKGGIINERDMDEFDRLVKYYGDEYQLSEELPFDNLYDWIKQCEVNLKPKE